MSRWLVGCSARWRCRARRRPEPASSQARFGNPQILGDLGEWFGPLVGSCTARRRNSGGWGAGTRTSFPVAAATSGQVSGLQWEAHAVCARRSGQVQRSPESRCEARPARRRGRSARRYATSGGANLRWSPDRVRLGLLTLLLGPALPALDPTVPLLPATIALPVWVPYVAIVGAVITVGHAERGRCRTTGRFRPRRTNDRVQHRARCQLTAVREGRPSPSRPTMSSGQSRPDGASWSPARRGNRRRSSTGAPHRAAAAAHLGPDPRPAFCPATLARSPASSCPCTPAGSRSSNTTISPLPVGSVYFGRTLDMVRPVLFVRLGRWAASAARVRDSNVSRAGAGWPVPVRRSVRVDPWS